ncbi:MAG TPA: arsenic resistance N-acetyltransferase ArsN2 [Gemmatimonadaceae bacterium]|nr:arsenic resistance N-acetyltransferase ArsN2 [Gemmatimonadaceae bacterium]
MLIRTVTGNDLPAVWKLLVAAGLPVEGVEENFSDFIVAEDGENRIAGVVGLERYGASALLRSAAVAPSSRGTGLGSRLVKRILERASSHGIRDVYLLTTTAEEYFPRFGFTRTARADVPEPVKASREFQGACPDSAVVMKRALAEAGGR